MPAIELPSGWREMRYVIVATLKHLGSDGPWWTSDLQYAAVALFVDTDDPVGYVEYGFDSATRRAWERALEILRAQGIVIYSDTRGFRLPAWDTEEKTS